MLFATSPGDSVGSRRPVTTATIDTMNFFNNVLTSLGRDPSSNGERVQNRRRELRSFAVRDVSCTTREFFVAPSKHAQIANQGARNSRDKS